MDVHDAEQRRASLKGRIAAADVAGAARALGVAEAVQRGVSDTEAFDACRARSGLLSDALVRLGERKRGTYTKSALPDLCKRATRIVQRVDPTLGVAARHDGTTVRWSAIVDGKHVAVRRASGFQKFIICFGLRIALGGLIRRASTLIVDEGFTACDALHVSRVPAFLESLLLGPDGYSGILLVTHIEAIQTGVHGGSTLTLKRGERVRV
jgi:hypothetical protein